MNVEPNFEGRGVPQHVKQLIDSLPEEYFYPPASRLLQRNGGGGSADDQQALNSNAATKNDSFISIGGTSEQPQVINAHLLNQLSQKLIEKQFQSVDKNEPLSSNSNQMLLFPEPSLILKQEEYNKRVAREQYERTRREELEKQRKRDYIEQVVHPLRQQRVMLYEEASDQLKELQQELLQNPPITLLNKLYRKGVDSPLVVHMLNQFERRNGTLISDQDRDQILPVPPSRTPDHSSDVAKSDSKSEDSGDKHEIRVQISSPKLQDLEQIMKQSGINGLSQTLIELNEAKKQKTKEIERRMEEKKLKFLLLMQREKKQYYSGASIPIAQQQRTIYSDSQQQKDDAWTEYLHSHFIKPYESKLMESLSRYIDDVGSFDSDIEELEKMKEQRSLGDDTNQKMLQFQLKNPIVAEDEFGNLKLLPRSKL